MKKLLPSLLVAAAVLVLVPSALASHSIKSTVFFDIANTVPSDLSAEYVAGHVTSDSKKCLANRTVKITGTYGINDEATSRPFDTAKTGKNGGFSGIGPHTSGGQELEAVKFKLASKSIGTKQHPKTCAGDSVAAD